jgi:hypothetical protein
MLFAQTETKFCTQNMTDEVTCCAFNLNTSRYCKCKPRIPSEQHSSEVMRSNFLMTVIFILLSSFHVLDLRYILQEFLRFRFRCRYKFWGQNMNTHLTMAVKGRVRAQPSVVEKLYWVDDMFRPQFWAIIRSRRKISYEEICDKVLVHAKLQGDLVV